MTNSCGVLLTNTGTPDAPTSDALKRYLRTFLSDRRIVDLPSLLWLPLLYGVIVPIRAPRSAKLYQNIWREAGSPMRIIMQRIRDRLTQMLKMPVEMGMHYGSPSIQAGLSQLKNQGVETVLVLPLFPQYSYTTTSASLDRVLASLKASSPDLSIIPIFSYAHHPRYLEALTQSVHAAWQQHGRGDHLLISFHGIPERAIQKGDPYASQCMLTAKSLAHALALRQDQWTLCYQSRFGFAKWQGPPTFEVLKHLAKQGTKVIDIICPGFAADCLETLEEIAIRGRAIFMKSGGEHLRYISALNDTDSHINLLANLVSTNC